MKQEEKIDYLISYLISENKTYHDLFIPSSINERKQLLRALMNVRPPKPISKKFIEIQDSYLQQNLQESVITSLHDLHEIQPDIFLWQGDITKLRVDAIVNAGNDALLGCFAPCHGCIDNVIHTYAGVQLRLACNTIMQRQGTPEPVGQAKITHAFNLPSKYVLHTVGPLISSVPTNKDCELLASCYRSCIELADTKDLKSIAFCCISTGEFHFPNKLAAKIAIRTVQQYKTETHSKIKVIFNVFKEIDNEIYTELLG
ncbi:MAG: protein-ADP-ribose hydrolase [Bifidobacteriaceae bacterium]|nr:protein-ADP-ribose hydrolase [Bifidobacteriaceae bacterium]